MFAWLSLLFTELCGYVGVPVALYPSAFHTPKWEPHSLDGECSCPLRPCGLRRRTANLLLVISFPFSGESQRLLGVASHPAAQANRCGRLDEGSAVRIALYRTMVSLVQQHQLQTCRVVGCHE